MSDADTHATAETANQPPVVVKKYANRRLYNTESSSYITLDNLATMIRARRDFVVYDAKSGEDITRGVLTQIIMDEESKGRAMLPTAFLRQIIGFYGDNLQQFIPSYLEQAMSSFALQQEQMRTAMQQTMGNFFPFSVGEVGRQNMAMMERAMSMFTPFYRPGAAGAEQASAGGAGTEQNGASQGDVPATASGPADVSADVHMLRHEVDMLRAQLAAARSAAVAQPARGRAKRDPAPEKAMQQQASEQQAGEVKPSPAAPDAAELEAAPEVTAQ